ncbi:thioredoxin family protein [Sphingobacterium griseoflavum]|nr:thioredoxin family protein [Sphingobacterium griseoflavum]
MKRYVMTFLVFCSSLLLHAQGRAAINWLTFEQLSDSLHVNPKPVLLFFHTDWCVYCRKMDSAVFTDKQIIYMLNSRYYAVRFDAESVDSLCFDGQILTNKSSKKRRGSYHDIAKILAARHGDLIFPTTLILSPDFTVQQRYFEYLSPEKLLKTLQ